MVEQAVIVTYELPRGWVCNRREWDGFKEFSRRLSDAIGRAGAGELDGHDVSEENLLLYAYGPDADSLYAVMEKHLQEFPARPAWAELRYGDVSDLDARTRRIDL